MRLCNKTIIII